MTATASLLRPDHHVTITCYSLPSITASAALASRLCIYNSSHTSLYKQQDAPDAIQLEEQAIERIQAAVAERYAGAIAGPEIQQRIEDRLKEERARLEARLEAQLEDERQALLEKKRKVGC